MSKKLFLSSVVVFICSTVMAGDKAGNGGEPVALSFRATAEQAIELFEKSGLAEATPELISRFRERLASVKIVGSQEALWVEVDGKLQECTVINYPHLNLITVSSSWDLIFDSKVKLALALHELAGLTGHEASGVYTISAKFLYILGYAGGEATLKAAQLKSRQNKKDIADIDEWLLLKGRYTLDVLLPYLCGESNEYQLPTARDVAEAFQLRGARGIVEVSDAPKDPVLAARFHQEFIYIKVTNRGLRDKLGQTYSEKDEFYFSPRGYQQVESAKNIFFWVNSFTDDFVGVTFDAGEGRIYVEPKGEYREPNYKSSIVNRAACRPVKK